MQKLLQVSLISDLSSSFNDRDDEYGQGWATIEGHMKAIICKDNGMNKNKNNKRLVLTLNNSLVKQNNSPSKVSPKPFNVTKSPSINSFNQKFTVSTIFERSNFMTETQNKPFQEKKSNTILNKNESRIIYQEEDSKNLSIQDFHYQQSNQQKKLNIEKVNIVKKQQLPPIFNDNHSKLKIQPLMKPRKSTVQQLFLSHQNSKEDFHLNIKEIPVKLEKDKKEKFSMFEIEKKMIESQFQCYNEENLFKISKMKILVPLNKINTNSQQKLSKHKSRAKSDHSGNPQTQCYKIYRIFQKENQIKAQKQKTNRNQSVRLTLEQTKKKVNKLKIMIIENNFRNFSNKQNKGHENYHYNSLKSLQRDPFILPLIVRQHNSEKKLQKHITPRKKKGLSFFQNSNFLRQKNKRHSPKTKNILDLDADKKRIQSIKLIVNKKKQFLGSSSVPKRFFEEIKMDRNSQEGRFRKMTISEFFRKMSINGEIDLQKDGTYRQFERKKYSKSCQQNKKQINPQVSKIKNFQHQIIRNELQLKTKAIPSQQKIINIHSNSKRSISKSKQKADLKQKNLSQQQKNTSRQRNFPVFKIQPDKHRSKLLIIKR